MAGGGGAVKELIVLASKNKFLEFLVDPDVDEEVGEVVDVDRVENVFGDGNLREKNQGRRQVAGNGQD